MEGVCCKVDEGLSLSSEGCLELCGRCMELKMCGIAVTVWWRWMGCVNIDVKGWV